MTKSKRYKRFKFHAGVMCDGHMHRIGISKKGRFAIIDHSATKLPDWDNWAELGGKLPVCVATLINTLTIIKKDAGNGLDRGNWPIPMVWYEKAEFVITGSKSGKLREFIAGCLAKRMARRNKHERLANQRSRHIHS